MWHSRPITLVYNRKRAYVLTFNFLKSMEVCIMGWVHFWRACTWFLTNKRPRCNRRYFEKSRKSSNLMLSFFVNAANTLFKKDLSLQSHLHKTFCSDDRFFDSLHKSFLNLTTLNLRKEKWPFLNRKFTLFEYLHVVKKQQECYFRKDISHYEWANFFNKQVSSKLVYRKLLL